MAFICFGYDALQTLQLWEYWINIFACLATVYVIMADLTQNFHPPAALNISTGKIAENNRKWKQQLNVFLVANGFDNKPAATKCAMILYLAGEDVWEIGNHVVYATLPDGTVEDRNDPEILLTVFFRLSARCG